MSPLLTKLIGALGVLTATIVPASHLIPAQDIATMSQSISGINSAINSALQGSLPALSQILQQENTIGRTPPSTVTGSTANIFATPAGGSSSSGFIVLKLGSRNVAVAVLQKLLIQNGYLVSTEETGTFDAATQAAVEADQSAQGLPQTGIVSIPTGGLAAFFSSVASSFTALESGSSGSQVTSVQRALIERNYLKIASPTGYFGSATAAAITTFQAANGLPQTGIMDQATFDAMNGK